MAPDWKQQYGSKLAELQRKADNGTLKKSDQNLQEMDRKSSQISDMRAVVNQLKLSAK